MNNRYLFTSESVTEGHPDKIADQISDAILDDIISKDPYGRVAVETMVATGLVLVAGQITTSCYVDIPRVIRKTIREIGYTRAKYGFDADTCAVITSINEQAKDIDGGVSKSLEARMGEENASLIGAGDQGMMFGSACNETPELMPLPIMLAHRLVYRLTWLRKEKILPYFRPDGKSQVTVEYENGIPKKVTAVIIAAQHSPDVSSETLQKDIKEKIINYVIPQKYLDPCTKYYINTTGRFVEGGPKADTGLTGRKIIVDTYGGMGRHGGGCFSGKDPTKVDRSGSYAARYVAKNIVAAGLADKCEVQIAYAIGVAHPVSIMVDTFGTGKIPNSKIITLIKENFDLQPEAIINHLNLRRPIYKKTAAYGHFGREDKDFTWEKTDKAEILKNAIYHISTLVPSIPSLEKKMKKIITLANFKTGIVKNTITGEVKTVDANLSEKEVMARWMKKRKADEEKYLEWFKKKSDKELIYCFNDQVGNGGCVAAKMDYLSAMHSEFINRGWDYSVVGDEGRFCVARRVKLVEEERVWDLEIHKKNVLKLTADRR